MLTVPHDRPHLTSQAAAAMGVPLAAGAGRRHVAVRVRIGTTQSQRMVEHDEPILVNLVQKSCFALSVCIPVSCRCPSANLLEELHNLLHVGLGEDATDALIIEVRKGALIEPARVHRSSHQEI